MNQPQNSLLQLIHSFILLVVLVSFSGATHADITAPKMSVQLHSVKQKIAEDFEGTLKIIADMGFDGVEFAGRYGAYAENPEGLRKFLNELGLSVSGVHASIPKLRGEQGLKNFAFYQALGAPYVIIPHDKRIDNPEEIDALIAELNALSANANTFGLKLGYHNHAKEFVEFNRSEKEGTFWDYLAQNTDENFVLQIDAGWVIYAGYDPADFVERHANRTQTTHFKVRNYQGKPVAPTENGPVVVGQDAYNWQALIKACIEHGATEWIVVEQEEYTEELSKIDAIRLSKKAIDNMLKKVLQEKSK